MSSADERPFLGLNVPLHRVYFDETFLTSWQLSGFSKVNSRELNNLIVAQRCNMTTWIWVEIDSSLACCLPASSHCPSQRQLIISGVLQLSPVGDFTRNAQGIYSWNIFENCYLRPQPHFPGTNEFRSFGQGIAHHIKQVCVYNNHPTH